MTNLLLLEYCRGRRFDPVIPHPSTALSDPVWTFHVLPVSLPWALSRFLPQSKIVHARRFGNSELSMCVCGWLDSSRGLRYVSRTHHDIDAFTMYCATPVKGGWGGSVTLPLRDQHPFPKRLCFAVFVPLPGSDEWNSSPPAPCSTRVFSLFFSNPRAQTIQTKRERESGGRVRNGESTPKPKRCVRLYRPRPWHTRNFLRH